MKALITYLMFNGNCREAMQHYQATLGGDLHLMTYGEAKQGPPEVANRIMHAKLNVGPAALMASDTEPWMPLSGGENFSLSIDCDGADEQDRLFATLGEGGAVSMPLQDTSWGARFGTLRDRFGIGWMLNCDQLRA